MSFFQEVEGEAAVLVENGVYKQVGLFTRDGFLYAKIGGGFVRLMADGATTKAKLRLDFMSWTGPLAKDALGRLCSPDVAGAKRLTGDLQQKLLGGDVKNDA
jgi:hypothetical protein